LKYTENLCYIHYTTKSSKNQTFFDFFEINRILGVFLKVAQKFCCLPRENRGTKTEKMHKKERLLRLSSQITKNSVEQAAPHCCDF